MQPVTRTDVRPQRVLACTLCSQRKVKCDRSFPCANCTKAGARCVPTSLLPRQRKRRLPERELLDKLQRYEGLLRQNNISFEGKGEAEKPLPTESGSPGTQHSETVYEAKSLWQAMTEIPDDDSDESEDSPFNHDIRNTLRRKTWEHMHEGNDQLLFGPRGSNIDISALHPDQGQIFKLWQVYLENVDPLLKVTHTPTLQPRVLDAASDLSRVPPPLEALMFGIYCVSTLSLTDDDCAAFFGTTRKDSLREHQLGCQQALINCGILRSGDRDSLTALFFYLISLRADYVDPRSLSPMLGLAVRIAQRMELHNEASHANHPPLEAEMRRRLWWALVLFDQRISELSDAKVSMLNPTWDCKIPLNINDFDLRQEMKAPPTEHDRPSEALFATVRSEINDTIRHNSFHLDFTIPALKAIAKPSESLAAMEKRLEDKYFKFCSMDNPLHFITVWMSRGLLAKMRLLEHYAKHSSPQQTDENRDEANTHAIDILICDTMLASSTIIKGFQWLVHYYFPLPAYMNIARDLQKRPTATIGNRAWEAMAENYRARFSDLDDESPMFAVFGRLLIYTWKAREVAFRNSAERLPEPYMIASIKQRLGNFEDYPSDPDRSSMQNAESSSSMAVPDLPSMDFDMEALDWTAIDWNPIPGLG